MTFWKYTIMVVVLAFMSAPVLAQEADELDARMREAEERLAAQEAQMAERAAEAERIAQERALKQVERAEEAERVAQESALKQVERAEEVEVRMRAAEAELARAAREVADLSMQNLPRVAAIERYVRANRGGPVLGVTIDAGKEDDPVEGVEIIGVSPGGAAAEAGIRAGDIITSVNGESLTSDSSHEANQKLLDFMEGVEDGDVLDIEYLRNGKTVSVEVAPQPIRGGLFAFEFDGEDFNIPEVHVGPEMHKFAFAWGSDGGFGDMELVALTERLGSYFGTDEGLLVVRAPEDEDLQLEDGDVILNIDGREPTSVSHAMRILGSYQGGESLKIEIMRDKRKRTVEIEIPENRQSSVQQRLAPKVQVVPRQRIVIAPEERT